MNEIPQDGALAAPARPQRGDELELEVQSLAFGGEGVARLGDGGYVVFVAGAIPGDRVRAVVHKRKRSYAHARTLEVLRPSPERIAPQAHHPGVPWQVLPYERQLEVKREQVGEALRRIGGLEDFELEPITPALEQWRYRNKLEYSFGSGPDGELICGFHDSAGARSVSSIDDCLLASERGNRARALVHGWCREQGLQAWERGHSERRGEPIGPASDGRVRLRNVVVREGRRSGTLQVRLVTTDGELDPSPLGGGPSEGLGAELSGLRGRAGAAGRDHCRRRDGAGVGRRGAGGAAVRPGAAHLRGGVLSDQYRDGRGALRGDRAVRRPGEWERVYDLYCGIGSIGLTLAPHAGELWGIELLEPAVADAIAGARRNGITNATSSPATPARRCRSWCSAPGARTWWSSIHPRRAFEEGRPADHRVGVPSASCTCPATPPRWLPTRPKWSPPARPARVRPVDMFPQTHHIESVALLERK